MKKLFTKMLVFVLAITTLAGCGNKKSHDESNNKILFNGSTSLAPVISEIAKNFNEKYVTWDKVKKGFPKENISIYVSSGGSGQGVKSVIDQTSDFGMLARSIKPEEKKKIKDLQEYQIGIDALTIAINPKNPLAKKMDNLTSQQIVDLFSGKYKTWNDFDSSLPKQDIVVITRDVNGGAHEVFQKKIMKDKTVRSDAIQAASMGELVKNIADNQWAIGYASYGVIQQNKQSVHTLKIDGVEANKENIINGSYLIQRPLLLIKSKKPSSEQKAFLDYIMSDDGRKIIEDMGFIPTDKR